MPAFARWPGKVAPGQIISTVAATYDIFPTVASLAGASLPEDRIYDGRDLSPVLFDNASTTIHDCLFHYKGVGEWGSDKPGLWAVRCGPYKMHFVISKYPASVHYMSEGVIQDPPLLFQIEADPSEQYPLDSKTAEYQHANATIHAAILAHVKGLEPVENQIALGNNNDYAVCGCPTKAGFVESTESLGASLALGSLPNCTCDPNNYHLFVCQGRTGL